MGTTEEGNALVPSAPRHLQAIIASNRFITLAWHEPERNNDHIVGYSVYYRQEGSLRCVGILFSKLEHSSIIL